MYTQVKKNGLRISITTLNTEMNTNCERNLFSCHATEAFGFDIGNDNSWRKEKQHISPEKDQELYHRYWPNTKH